MNLARLVALVVVTSALTAAPALALERPVTSAVELAPDQLEHHQLAADHVEHDQLEQLEQLEQDVVQGEVALELAGAAEDAVSQRGIGLSPLNSTGHTTMPFRAKCRITGVHSANSLHKYPDGSLPIECMHVTLQPVFGAGDDDANKSWSKWTPSGELKLSITNPEIYPELVNGKLFFVDFTPIEG